MALVRVIPLLVAMSVLCHACSKEAGGPSSLPEVILPATHAGSWYPAGPQELRQLLGRLLAKASQELSVDTGARSVRALVAPHAGYSYAGLVPAAAYATLTSRIEEDGVVVPDKRIQKVIILAPSHAQFFSGLGLPQATHLATPLGNLEIDTKSCQQLYKDGVALHAPYLFTAEHSLEMQLPFLKLVVPQARVVPLIVGRMSDQLLELVVASLRRVIDAGTLVCVSSDFVHHGRSYDYEPFERNIVPSLRLLDGALLQALCTPSMRDFGATLASTQATVCGREPLKLLLALMQAGVVPVGDGQLACYYTSAHTQYAGVPAEQMSLRDLFAEVPDAAAASSVSYASMVFFDQAPASLSQQFSGFNRQALLALARAAIHNDLLPHAQQVDAASLVPVLTPVLQVPAGVFVSLHSKRGALRGCIGRIVSDQPLYQTVIQMAVASATQDSRFRPVTLAELDDLVVELTILGVPRPVKGPEEIVLGKHGIVLTKYDQSGQKVGSAVFLPQVATSFGWTLETTLAELSKKAGLSADAWQQDCRFEVFEGLVCVEHGALRA